MMTKGSTVQIAKSHLGVDSELEGVIGEVLEINNAAARVRIPNGIVDCKLEELKEVES